MASACVQLPVNVPADLPFSNQLDSLSCPRWPSSDRSLYSNPHFSSSPVPAPLSVYHFPATNGPHDAHYLNASHPRWAFNTQARPHYFGHSGWYQQQGSQPFEPAFRTQTYYRHAQPAFSPYGQGDRYLDSRAFANIDAFRMNNYHQSAADRSESSCNGLCVSSALTDEASILAMQSYHTSQSKQQATQSHPIGPPRKPQFSDHALWVGSLPAIITIHELKELFSCGAKDEITSVFLIAKSNCAFVNYRSEAACRLAAQRFHNFRLNGSLLNCRLRRNTDSSHSIASSKRGTSSTPRSSVVSASTSSDSISTNATTSDVTQSDTRCENQVDLEPRVPEKYFIIKSLTVSDLTNSVITKEWATQPGNEDVLNRAFEKAENVYLFFSANKSGEYFGLARMNSAITEQAGKGEVPESAVEDSNARYTVTPASDAAPAGRIYDDALRGTIFWEIDSIASASTALDSANNARSFGVEWLSTSRVPFYRTKGLRNPFNQNREVKVTRHPPQIRPA